MEYGEHVPREAKRIKVILWYYAGSRKIQSATPCAHLFELSLLFALFYEVSMRPFAQYTSHTFEQSMPPETSSSACRTPSIFTYQPLNLCGLLARLPFCQLVLFQYWFAICLHFYAHIPTGPIARPWGCPYLPYGVSMPAPSNSVLSKRWTQARPGHVSL